MRSQKTIIYTHQVVLSRNFDFVKLGEFKFSQIVTEVFEVLYFGSIIQEDFKVVAPESETLNQSRQSRLTLDKVLFKCRFVLLLLENAL